MLDNPSRTISAWRLLPLGVLLAAGALFMAMGGHHYLTFASLAEHREWLCSSVEHAGVRGVLAFIAIYAGLVMLSVPGGLLLTITAGFLFGPCLGAAYTVIGATLGATVVFLAARAGFAGLLERAGPWVRRLETGFRNNGLNYLLILRLVPIFPFWLVNLVAAAVGLRLSVFLLGTVIGIIPATFVFASLGSGFGDLVATGRPPDPGILFHPAIFLPILGLALLILTPVIWRYWRGRGHNTA